MSNKFSDKVDAGASYLDLAQPGWAEKIDLNTLDLGSSSHCVIGQSVGQFMDGIEKLGLSQEAARALGYNCNSTSDYEELGEAWIPVIKARQPQPSTFTVQSSGTYVNYRIELDREFPQIVRTVGGSDERQFQVGTADPRVTREIGEAFIALAALQQQ